MKTILRLSFIFICVLSLQGCIIQSFNPFFTADAVVESPIAIGEWLQIDEKGKLVDDKPWAFNEEGILTYDDEGGSGLLDAVYFKIDDSIFVDITAGEPSEGLSSYWVWNIVPVHTLCKVEFKDENLILIPLGYEWFDKAEENKTLTLPHTLREDEMFFFTATSEEWMAFLKKNLGEKTLFDKKYALKFIKQSK